MDRLDTSGRFGPGTIVRFVDRFPAERCFVVAFSGGADSLALLHAFARARERHPGLQLRAVHVDHHLHPESTEWAHRCAETCRRLSVPLTVLDADLDATDTGPDEGAARTARYQAFERNLATHDVLCTAHSRDDHVETVLLNLLRGAGPRGLAGVPERRRLGEGALARPVRGVSRAELRTYARATGVTPVHDPANEDLRFSRVVLRREVIPLLQTRWPGMQAAVARAAELGRESAELLDALAALDLAPAGGIRGETLEVGAIAALEPARRRNAIGSWLRTRGIAPPGARRIGQIARDVVEARPDAMPCVRLGEAEVRRFRGHLRLVPRTHPVAAQVVCRCRIPDTVALDHGELAWEPCTGGGIDDTVRDSDLVVRCRGDGPGSPRPSGGRGRSLKKRFQSLGIPPWERGRIPLVYAGGVLAAVGSVWVDPRLAAPPGAPGWRVVWTPRP